MTMMVAVAGCDGGYQSITRTICNTSPRQSSEDLYFIDIDIAWSYYMLPDAQCYTRNDPEISTLNLCLSNLGYRFYILYYYRYIDVFLLH